MDLQSVFPDDQARSNFLSSARQEMYNALALFHAHVRHTLSLMFAIMAIIFGISGLGPGLTGAEQQMLGEFRLIGGIVLSLLLPLGIVSIFIIARYYKLYVAALVYAAELHESVSLASHVWFEDIRNKLKSLSDDEAKQKLVRERTYGWPHSWILYSLLIAILSTASLVSGIIILVNI